MHLSAELFWLSYTIIAALAAGVFADRLYLHLTGKLRIPPRPSRKTMRKAE